MKYLLSFLLFCISTGYVFSENIAQDSIYISKNEVRYDTESSVNKIEFDSDKINSYKKDKVFDYTEKEAEENWWTSFTKWAKDVWNRFWRWVFGDYKDNGVISFFLGLLPYLIIAGIIIFIVWLFYKLNPGASLLKSKEKPEIFFTEEEEIIKSKDIQQLIQKALENKDYRLAIRYHYLLLLKNLSKADLIEYEFDKTNNDYLKEISLKSLSQSFGKATMLYDYIWYGNFSVTDDEFQKAQRVFTTISHQIPKSNE